ncbi:TetR family transcriptional regulator [Frankia sp. Mgl5]|uniref:TetR family transcriptional regulator n=1 Tax=Frankia sp. Mgl5 TaxID=2933793 RepID=UPI00200C66A6|nr:TetR family transcriptional regulator [Frankia sp. Mgl5]MCK9929486.1 TetR family transcriptional regulator [Frankia sp. Mgl5]
MTEPLGLRDRKKRRTRDALSAAAVSLFLERGFERVSVAEVAAAAEVSKPTLFSYFPAKEDLVLHRVLDHRGEAARVVRARSADQSPLAALEAHFLAGLRQHEPVTGLCDVPEVLAYHRLVFSTPSLLGRMAQYTAADEDALADAFAEAAGSPAAQVDARLAAAAVLTVQRVLARENWHRLDAGAAAADVLPDAEAAARRAFGALAGLANLPGLASLPGLVDLPDRADRADRADFPDRTDLQGRTVPGPG